MSVEVPYRHTHIATATTAKREDFLTMKIVICFINLRYHIYKQCYTNCRWFREFYFINNNNYVSSNNYTIILF